MQLYAFDENSTLVSAYHATKQKDYYCLECQGLVRVRSGVHRQAHFFHFTLNKNCGLSKKSLVHLQVQRFLQRILPQGESVLEKPFPTINRIADVAWLPQKLLFEVQCSQITAQEVERRNQDYGSLGYQVVWIFHDKRFNKRKVTAAEQLIRPSPYYYTNINAMGQGCIYDQFDVICGGLRRSVLKPLAVDLSRPKTVPQESKPNLKLLKYRLKNWPIHFTGDLLDRTDIDEYLYKARQTEASLEPAPKSKWEKIRDLLFYLIRPYRLVFQLLLERACR